MGERRMQMFEPLHMFVVDLIVMGLKGYIIKGSITDTILEGSRCPFLKVCVKHLQPNFVHMGVGYLIKPKMEARGAHSQHTPPLPSYPKCPPPPFCSHMHLS